MPVKYVSKKGVIKRQLNIHIDESLFNVIEKKAKEENRSLNNFVICTLQKVFKRDIK